MLIVDCVEHLLATSLGTHDACRLQVFSERGEEDFLRRKEILLEGVFLSPPLGDSDGDPVGSLIAGSAEAVNFDEGLKEDGGVVVALLPVVRKASCRHAKEHGGDGLGHG